MELDGQGAADKLHALAQGFEFTAEDRVTDAKAVKGIGNAAPIARPPEALDALQIGDVQVARLLGPLVATGCHDKSLLMVEW